MECRWCGGTGKHQGDGPDECEHCLGTGETATPPGTPLRNVLSDKTCLELAHHFVTRRGTNAPAEFDAWLAGFVQTVAVQASGQQLEEGMLSQLVAYWEDPRRDETLGEFIQRVAQCANEALAAAAEGGCPPIDPATLNVGDRIRRRPCGYSCEVEQLTEDRAKVLVRDFNRRMWVKMTTIVRAWRR